MPDTTPRRRAPLQTPRFPLRVGASIPWDVHLRAYEVYSVVYSPQEALVEGGCRGGFGLEELVGFLYAYGFPREEWRDRVEKAWREMDFGTTGHIGREESR